MTDMMDIARMMVVSWRPGAMVVEAYFLSGLGWMLLMMSTSTANRWGSVFLIVLGSQLTFAGLNIMRLLGRMDEMRAIQHLFPSGTA